MNFNRILFSAIAVALALIGDLIEPTVRAQTLTTLYAFPALATNRVTGLMTNASGAIPVAHLTAGSDGNFYGSTSSGGTNGYGTIFQLTPDGALTTLATFAKTNGANPWGALTSDTNGVLWGTTYNGGAGSLNFGTVFTVTTNGVLTTMASFGKTNGSFPAAGLTWGSNGCFYGTTEQGGRFDYDFGTVFKVDTNGLVTTLFTMQGPNGGYPDSGVVLNTDGNFYGTTTYGGVYNYYGSFFGMTPGGAETTLVSFNNNSNGYYPSSTLILVGGRFYGANYYAGANGSGTVFCMSNNPPSAAWKLEWVYSFPATVSNGKGVFTNDMGAGCSADLLDGGDGYLYGVTRNGGINGNGAFFRLTTNGLATALYSFPATASNQYGTYTNANGANPTGGLVRGGDGGFYGITWKGGPAGQGTVFKLTLPPSSISLEIQSVGNQVVLTWSDPAYALQSAPACTGTFTNIPDATSPYTNPVSGDQQFFRLKSGN